MSAPNVDKRPPYMAVVAAMLAVSVVMAVFWHDMPYRPDEAWTVQLGLHTTPPELVQHLALNDWAALPAPWLSVRAIAQLVGHHETPMHYAHWLMGLLTMALTYQLGKRLYSPSVGVLAVALYGVTPLFMLYAPEARSYPYMLLSSAALMLLFVRWLDRPTFWHALGYVGAGILGVYSHQYVVYLVVAQAAYLLIGVRWQWGRVLRGFALFALVALALVGGWGIVIGFTLLRTDTPVFYAWPFPSYGAFVRAVLPTIAPSFLGAFVVWGLFVPNPPAVAAVYRWRTRASAGYATTLLLAMTAIVYASNQFLVKTLTDRNLLLILPLLVVLMAAGLQFVPRRPTALLLAALMLVNLNTVTRVNDYTFSALGEQVGPLVDADTLVIVETSSPWLVIDALYHLVDRAGVPPSQIIAVTDHLVRPTPDMFPLWPRDIIAAQDDAAVMMADVQAAQVVWVTWVGASIHGDTTREQLTSDYYASPLANFSDPYLRDAMLYRPLPDVDAPQVRFQHADLMTWDAPRGLTAPACDSVPLHTWWQSADDERPNMGIALTLIGADGGELARSEGRLTQAETALWDTDTLQLDERTLSIPCDVPAGSYALLAAVSADGVTLPTLDEDGAPNGPAYTYLANIEVTP